MVAFHSTIHVSTHTISYPVNLLDRTSSNSFVNTDEDGVKCIYALEKKLYPRSLKQIQNNPCE